MNMRLALAGSFIAARPERVLRYRYRCDDGSLLSPYLRRLLCARLAKYIPVWVSPNLVSLTASAFSALAFVLLLSWLPPGAGNAPSWVSGGAALGIFAYLVLDNADGIHARRLGISSPLGDFVDHWFDAFSSFMTPLGLLLVFQASAVTMVGVVALAVFAFWVANWEMLETGVLRLPKVGDVEGNVLAIAIHTATACVGVGIWQTPVLGLPCWNWLLVGVGVVLLHASVAPFLKVRSARAGLAVGVVASLLAVGSWALFVAQGVRGAQAGSALPAVLLGLVGVKHIGDLQRAHLVGASYAAFDTAILGSAAALWLGAVADDLLGLRMTPTLAVCALCVVGVKLARQFGHTRRFVAESLGIRLLQVTPAAHPSPRTGP